MTRGDPSGQPTQSSATHRLSILLPDGHFLGTRGIDLSLLESRGIDLSRDGSTLVFSARSPNSPAQLHLRRLNEFESQVIPNTKGALYPEFSPDGERVAYFAQSKLYVQLVSGGQPKELCDSAGGWGISWDQDGTIVFGNLNERGLQRVSASGEDPSFCEKSGCVRGSTIGDCYVEECLN